MTSQRKDRGTAPPAPGKPERCLPCSLAGLLLLAALVGAVGLLLR